jgi:hypothetical protein
MAGTLDKLLSLHGYEFEYTPEAVEHQLALPGRQYGLIAQEVEAVFPDWVGKDGGGLKHVTERSTTALIVEVLRDLRAEKDRELADRDLKIHQQRLRIQDLEARLARLERALAGATEER